MAGLAVAGLIGAAPTAAGATAPLTPVGQWIVDYNEVGCFASHKYQGGTDSETLALKYSPGGHVVQALVVEPGNDSHQAEQSTGFIQIDGGKSVIKRFLVYGVKTATGSSKMRSTLLGDAEIAQLPAARSLTLAWSGERREFTLANMAPLTKAMSECIADLREYWNMDEQSGATIRPTLVGKIGNYISSSDYPDIATHNLNEGTSEILLLVDESGKVRGCFNESTTGFAALDGQACAAAERIRFTPPHDPAGKPMRSVFPLTIDWNTIFG
ncbi:TonB family protein [Sphingomonas sp. ASV193]|uniref:TonB family protein n=1 Tax=Sphingomonas sp. ASV193 TaxID=3144405 RepID=UPI0032E8B65C